MALRLRIGCETDDLCPEVYHELWRENRHLWFRKDHLPISASELHLNSATSNFLDSHSLFPRPPNVANHYSQRPNPGLWFTLLSTSNREGKVLPQIPKPYIRVKDSNVTVFMVKTYLVRKLGLSNEAEVEISCMGQNLLDSQTLKHVRDCIWLSKLVEFLNSNPTIVKDTKFLHRLMSLEYGRSCLINKEV
nr:protein LAX PANICLE 2-like [Coffea arabica]